MGETQAHTNNDNDIVISKSERQNNDIDNDIVTEEDIIALRNAVKLKQSMHPKQKGNRPELIGDIMRKNGIDVPSNTPTQSLRKKIKNRADKVDTIADNLVRKFKAPSSRNFFCKCAWKLSEDEIWTAYEQSNRPNINSPIKYFVKVCAIKMNS